MDFSSNIDLIIKDLTEVCEIIDDLKHYPGVPAFQVEIAKSKCRSAAEVIALLKTMKTSEPAATDKTFIDTDRKPSQEVKEKKVPEPVITPHIKSAASTTETVLTISDEKTTEEKITEKLTDSETLADKFTYSSGSLYEQIGNQQESDDLSERLKSKPISSLKEAIGLNDRFIFTREIFKGDKEAFNKAIAEIENSRNFEEAKSYLSKWGTDPDGNETFIQLLELVKRKFPSNE
jgi:hypothetical protein